MNPPWGVVEEIMRMIVLIRLVGLLGVTPVGLNADDFIKIGPGSYTSQRPEGCEPLPGEIYKVKSLKGATPTNQWWSSVVWEKHSQNLFPHPLAMVVYSLN